MFLFTHAIIFTITASNGYWDLSKEEKTKVEIIGISGNTVKYIEDNDNKIQKEHIDNFFIDDESYIVEKTYSDGGIFTKTICDLHVPLNIYEGE